jgi:uncharacterized protein
MIGDTFYGPQHRDLQDRFGSRPLADRLGDNAALELSEDRAALVGAADMFFLSTVDHEGRPTVSYKGGDPGFVRVLDPQTIMFPSYDGNGMYLSTGNLSLNPAVGLLFMSFERPQRIRIQGNASLSTRSSDLEEYPEAEMVVRVSITEVFSNCPRYVHRHVSTERSRYVPRPGVETPFAEWKRMDKIVDSLRPEDQARANELGIIEARDWARRVRDGDANV